MSLSKSGSRIDTPLYPEHSVKQMAVRFESGKDICDGNVSNLS